MPRGIGKGFLEDAEQVDRLYIVHFATLGAVANDQTLNTGAFLELSGLPFKRRMQAEVVEYGRAQFGDDAPRDRYRAIEQLRHRFDVPKQRRCSSIRGQLVRQP